MQTLVWNGLVWEPVLETPAPSERTVSSNQVVCAVGGAAYAPVFEPLGVDDDLWWFDPASRRWTPLPPLGPQGVPNPPDALTVGSSRLLRVGSRLFSLRGGAWVARRVPTGALTSLDRLLLVASSGAAGSSRRPRVVLVDPVRLPAAT